MRDLVCFVKLVDDALEGKLEVEDEFRPLAVDKSLEARMREIFAVNPMAMLRVRAELAGGGVQYHITEGW